MAGYRVALLERFEERETQAFIDMVEALQTDDGAEKLRELAAAVVTDQAHDTLEPQVRIWAGQDEVARAFLERVDNKRTAYLQRQCRAITDSSPGWRRTGDEPRSGRPSPSQCSSTWWDTQQQSACR